MFPKCVFSEGHTIVADTLADGAPCIDLGFNFGRFSGFIADTFRVPIIAMEPVSSLVENAPKIPDLTLYHAAIGGHDGEVSINVFEKNCASAFEVAGDTQTHAETVEQWSFDRLVEKTGAGDIGLVKVDVEGAEFGLFQESAPETLRQVRQYTVEFHDFLWPERRPEVMGIFDRMKSLGFTVIRFSHDNTNVVFLRNDMIRSRPLALLWLNGAVKYAMGLGRILSRQTKRLFK